MYTRHPRALIPRLIEALRIDRTLESVSLAAVGLEIRGIVIVCESFARTCRHARKGQCRRDVADEPPSWLRTTPTRFDANCMRFDDGRVAVQALNSFRDMEIAPCH